MPKGISEVKSVSSGGKTGYGFTVTDDAGKAVVTFAFQSKEIAEKGKERLTKIVDRSAWIAGG
jgi:hypothetical protein